MTETLVQFLRARLGEDEAFMRAALRLRESGAVAESPEATTGAFALMDVIANDPNAVEALGVFTRTGTRAPGEAERVLAEVEAKRRLLDTWLPEATKTDEQVNEEWGYGSTLADDLLRLLALPYADHPDYRDGWRP